MEEETHKIVFADGTEVICTLNGNNYISAVKVPDEVVQDVNLIGMTIDGIEQENVTCRHFQDEEGDHLIFAQLSPQELMFQEINAKIDYIAMMEDLDL